MMAAENGHAAKEIIAIKDEAKRAKLPLLAEPYAQRALALAKASMPTTGRLSEGSYTREMAPAHLRPPLHSFLTRARRIKSAMACERLG